MFLSIKTGGCCWSWHIWSFPRSFKLPTPSLLARSLPLFYTVSFTGASPSSEAKSSKSVCFALLVCLLFALQGICIESMRLLDLFPLSKKSSCSLFCSCAPSCIVLKHIEQICKPCCMPQQLLVLVLQYIFFRWTTTSLLSKMALYRYN